MSMYADYVLEKRGMKSIENEFGFLTYMICDGGCYIEDIYVKPEFRRTRMGSELADMAKDLARAHGCTYLTGSVNCQAIDPTTSVKALLGYGFKISKVINDVIFFKMEI